MKIKHITSFFTLIFVLFQTNNLLAIEELPSWTQGIEKTEYTGRLDDYLSSKNFNSTTMTTFMIEKQSDSTFNLVGKYSYNYQGKWYSGKLKKIEYDKSKNELIVPWVEGENTGFIYIKSKHQKASVVSNDNWLHFSGYCC